MDSLKNLFKKGFDPDGQGSEMVLSILFLDLRKFTTHVEHLSLKETYEFLNRLFSRLVPHITDNNGIIDKFMGDAIMALFDGEASADNSITAAINMQVELDNYNQERIEQGEKEILAGIGINTGEVMVGAIGNEGHLALTVVGDDVNLASRIEALTKRYNSKILVSHRTHAALKQSHYLIREVDTMRVRGRSQLVNIYEVFDSDSEDDKQTKLSTHDLLFQGVSLYKAGFFEEALEGLKETLRIFPRDEVAIRHIKRCRYFLKNPPSSDISLEDAMSKMEENLDHTLTKRSVRLKMNANGALHLSLRGTTTEQSHDLRVVLLDLSSTGMRLNTPKALIAGKTYDLRFTFEHEGWNKMFNGDVLAFAQIVWCKRKEDEGKEAEGWEAGIEFLVMEMEHEQSLQNGLDELDMGLI